MAAHKGINEIATIFKDVLFASKRLLQEGKNILHSQDIHQGSKDAMVDFLWKSMHIYVQNCLAWLTTYIDKIDVLICLPDAAVKFQAERVYDRLQGRDVPDQGF